MHRDRQELSRPWKQARALTSLGADAVLQLQVSWNIDCLNDDNKMARVEEVCAIVMEAEPTPDVILLQVDTPTMVDLCLIVSSTERQSGGGERDFRLKIG